MKKYLLIALLAFATIANAQEHMRFKGIEIDGTLPNMIKQLESKGFTKASQDKSSATFLGTFTGQTVVVCAFTTPISRTVCRIAVVYPENGDSWNVLSNQYEGLKERLKNKYGEPTEVVEKFESPYSVTSEPLLAFDLEKATYRTRFVTDNGGVTLSIIHYETETAVCLVYWDKENEAKMNAETEDEL